MAANSSVLVPAGTTVLAPNGTSVTVNGSSNTVHTQLGAVVNVPSSATGPATDLITTVAAGGTATGTALNVSVLAGSATTNQSPMDGTGMGAVLWGGGHIVVNPGTNNLLISDRGALKSVTQAGVTTTVDSSVDYEGIALDGAHNLFASGTLLSTPGNIATWGASIWERTSAGVVQDLALNWETSTTLPSLGSGGLAIDSNGNLYFADAIGNRVVRFTPTGVMSVFAGSGQAGAADGVGTAASFQSPHDLAIDAGGNLFVADNSGVRKITPDGTVSTAANVTGSAIAVDAKGSIFLSDYFSIKRLDASGNLTTFMLDSYVGFNSLGSLAVDGSGALYVDTRGQGAQILKITFN